jgi:hypothetical protein
MFHVVTLCFQAQAPGPAAAQLQIALKNNVGVNYFSDTVLLHAVFTENAPVDQVRIIVSAPSSSAHLTCGAAVRLSSGVEVPRVGGDSASAQRRQW